MPASAKLFLVIGAIAMLAAGLAAQRLPESKWLSASGWLMLAGIVIFSGSLCLMAVTGVRALGVVTPIGGGGFMVAWVLFSGGGLKKPLTPKPPPLPGGEGGGPAQPAGWSAFQAVPRYKVDLCLAPSQYPRGSKPNIPSGYIRCK